MQITILFAKEVPTCSLLHEVLHDLEVSVEAGRPQGRGVGLGGAVDVCAPVHEEADDAAVAGGGRAPQGGRALDRLAVKRDGAWKKSVGEIFIFPRTNALVDPKKKTETLKNSWKYKSL